MNSWSAAQRYFVEGDHVVQAEINRTFQFTGLDSGERGRAGRGIRTDPFFDSSPLTRAPPAPTFPPAGSFYPFLVWTTIATAISAVFMIIPWMIAPQRVDLDKSSAYECGFDAFGEARQTFSVSFYLVSIM
jgi:NADH-ubiquinone oxidoreductase chain 3